MSFIARSSTSTTVRRVNKEGCKPTPDLVEHPPKQRSGWSARFPAKGAEWNEDVGSKLQVEPSIPYPFHGVRSARPEEVEAVLFPASPFRLENEMTGTNCSSARSAGDDDGNRLRMVTVGVSFRRPLAFFRSAARDRPVVAGGRPDLDCACCSVPSTDVARWSASG